MIYYIKNYNFNTASYSAYNNIKLVLFLLKMLNQIKSYY